MKRASRNSSGLSIVAGGALRFFASAAWLMLSACGSGDLGSSTTPTPAQPSAFAYVASAAADPSAAGAIYEYGLFPDNSVSPLPQASIATGAYPAAVLVSQGHLYVVNAGDGTISQYYIESDSTLLPMNPATVKNPGMQTFGAAHAAATIDPTGSFLYVLNEADGTLSQFGIGAGGELTPLTPSTVATGLAPVAIEAILLPDGSPSYYVVNSGAPGETGSVSLYSSGQNGTLAPMDSDTVAAGTNPSAIAVNVSTVYVLSGCAGAQCAGSIKQFAIGTGGALTDTGATAVTGSHASSMLLSEEGNVGSYVYVLSSAVGADTSAGALWQYGVQSTGELAPVSPSSLSIAPGAIAQAMGIGTLYVLTANSEAANGSSSGGNMAFYALGAEGGAVLSATAKIDAPHPIALGVAVLLPP